jgi:hypothetical protein
MADAAEVLGRGGNRNRCDRRKFFEQGGDPRRIDAVIVGDQDFERRLAEKTSIRDKKEDENESQAPENLNFSLHSFLLLFRLRETPKSCANSVSLLAFSNLEKESVTFPQPYSQLLWKRIYLFG